MPVLQVVHLDHEVEPERGQVTLEDRPRRRSWWLDGDPGERLDRPAADHPPRRRKLGQALATPVTSSGSRRRTADRTPRRPSPVRDSTRSSRCTTSRSYAAPSSRSRSCVERPSSAGQLVGVEVDQAAGDRRCRRGRPGRPGRRRRRRPVTPVMPAASSDARALDDRPDGAGVEHAACPAARWRGPARAAGSGGACRSAWNRVPTGSPGQRRAGLVGGGQHDRDAGAGGDPGGVDLGPHAAGADTGARRRCRSVTAVEVVGGGHLGDQPACRRAPGRPS